MCVCVTCKIIDRFGKECKKESQDIRNRSNFKVCAFALYRINLYVCGVFVSVWVGGICLCMLVYGICVCRGVHCAICGHFLNL